jgi:chromosome segregation ATPase
MVEDLEHRLDAQHRRRGLPLLEGQTVTLEEQWRDADIRFNDADRVWIAANEGVREAKRALDSANAAIGEKRRDLANKAAELDGFRKTVAEADERLSKFQPEIERLRSACSAELRLRVESGDITIFPERAGADVESLRAALDRFISEGPIPAESVRQERRLVERNIDELERHVAARQREADAAREELDRWPGRVPQCHWQPPS